MKRIRSPLLLAAMALLAAGLTLWGSADRSFAGQTDQGYGAGGEARELDKEAQESMFSYQVEGEPESLRRRQSGTGTAAGGSGNGSPYLTA